MAQSLRKWGIALSAALSVAAGGALVTAVTVALPASEAHAKPAVADVVPLAALPSEAQRTDRLIRSGGPFPYAKDGTVFGNRERRLPRQRRGFYREYTVATPGADNRGARRIVCGGEQPSNPQACYYTDDHYTSFRLIVQ